MAFLKTCALLVIVPLLLVVSLFMVFELDDGTKFYALSSDKDSSEAPADFVWDNKYKRYINKGGRASLEDVVMYVNYIRAGADGVINTSDDKFDVEEQLTLLTSLLKQEYKGGYWADSEWHLNHNAGVSGQLKILYADINEYIMIFGNRFNHGGYAGCFDFDLYDYVLEGDHFTQFIGNMTRQRHTANWRVLRSTGEDPTAKLIAMMPRGKQKVYCSQAPEGAVMLEYARGKVSTSLYRAVILPTVFLTSDWNSLCVSMSSFTASVILNTILPWFGLFPYEEKSEDVKIGMSEEL